jgi:hypothetical protein
MVCVPRPLSASHGSQPPGVPVGRQIPQLKVRIYLLSGSFSSENIYVFLYPLLWFSFVRQAVLCALNMAVVATPTNYLLTDMHEALAETMLWVQGMLLYHQIHVHFIYFYTDVSSSDGDDDVRALAARSLSILAQVTGENT